MLRTYIYNEKSKSWIEEDTLLLHDSCAILDEEKQIIYLWNGPKSSPEKLKKGHHSIEKIIAHYPNTKFQLIILKNNLPDHVQKKIEEMLDAFKRESEEDEFQNFTRLITIRMFFFTNIIIIIFSILSLINLLRFIDFFNWDGYIVTNSEQYNLWLFISSFLILIILIIFGINLGISIIEYDHQSLIFSISGLLITIGLLLYLSQGIYLFLFKKGSTSSIFLIWRVDLNWFFIIIFSAELIYLIPNTLNFIKFLKNHREYLFL
jgi:hypothetical protein